jgi:serine/threonine-protein kinase HipA
MRNASIQMHGIPAGTLTETEDGYTFGYHTEYLDLPTARSVSLSLPLQQNNFHDKRLFPFFDGLIPEGWLLEIAENTWKIDARDRMGLLMACCSDCIGAVSVLATKDTP